MSNFTDTFIRNLKPKTQRYEEYEGAGFGIRVSPNGLKTWIYRYKIDNKTSKINLGHYPTMTLANAKKKFLELSELKRSGTCPKIKIQSINEQSYTVEQLATAWYNNYIVKHLKRPLTVNKQIQLDIIPLLGMETLEKLQTKDITIALDKIVARGARVHANRVLSSLKQMFNYAVSRGHMQQNPANNIRAKDIGGHEKPKERYLTLEEIKLLWSFLDSGQSNMSKQIQLAIKIIILTGVRTTELRLAKWENIDYEQSIWIIPAQDSKVNTVLKIHLSNIVKELFKELSNTSQSQYVLTGINGVSQLTENALPRSIKRIQDRLGIEQWTAHDLRRTFATQLGESLNIDPVVIEKCLGHKMPRIMATYNKNEMLPQRKDALEKWALCVKNFLNYERVDTNLANIHLAEVNGF